MNLHIGICDDENTELEYLKFLISKWYVVREIACKTTTFNSAESFLFEYEEDKSFDILLLDIQMKEINGMDLAKRIRKDNKTVQIAFITGLPDFIGEGYEVSALHYLMKPVSEEKLFSLLDKAKENLNRTEKPLLITSGGELLRIPRSDIRYVEAMGHYITIFTCSAEYKAKINLSQMQEMLGDGFFRCQRSFIVNLKYVSRVARVAVILDDMSEIPLSRELYNAANEAIIKFFP